MPGSTPGAALQFRHSHTNEEQSMNRNIESIRWDDAKAARNLDDATQRRFASDLFPGAFKHAPHTGTVSIVRISFAVDPDFVIEHTNWQGEVARLLQGLVTTSTIRTPLDLGLSFGYGVGEWGVEECVHIETATPVDVGPFIQYCLTYFRQTCAYVTFNGCEAYEYRQSDGAWNPITGV